MSASVELDQITGMIRVTLEGHVTLSDFGTVNQAINETLREPDFDAATLVFDFHGVLTTPYNIQNLRASQTYANRTELRCICVMGDNKFMRLIMTLTFNLAKAQLRFFADERSLDMFLQTHMRAAS